MLLRDLVFRALQVFFFFCYFSPSLETVEHIFGLGEILSQVWVFLKLQWNCTKAESSAYEADAMVASTYFESVLIILASYTSILILWLLWKARNDWFFTGNSQS